MGVNQNKLLPFTRLIWFHSFLIMEKYIVESPQDQVVSISRQVFTDVKCSLYQFLSSKEFSRYVCQLFATAKCSPAQKGVAVELTPAVHHQFLDKVKFVINEQDKRKHMLIRYFDWFMETMLLQWPRQKSPQGALEQSRLRVDNCALPFPSWAFSSTA